MNEIRFDDGRRSFKVNGAAEIQFNPTDISFIKRVQDAYGSLKKKQSTYQKEIEAIGDDPEKLLDYCMGLDKEMRDMIDSCFTEPVCQKVFGYMNVYSMSNGLPIWSHFMRAVEEQCEAALKEEDKASRELAKKYAQD